MKDPAPFSLAPPNRYDPDDEIVVHSPTLVHLERMSDGAFWLGIILANGDEIHVDFYTSRVCKHKLRMRAEKR
jgi:hypothetical protein